MRDKKMYWKLIVARRVDKEIRSFQLNCDIITRERCLGYNITGMGLRRLTKVNEYCQRQTQ